MIPGFAKAVRYGNRMIVTYYTDATMSVPIRQFVARQSGSSSFVAEPQSVDPATGGFSTVHHSAASLDDIKMAAYRSIDRRTDALILKGFPYRKTFFSLSNESQQRMLTMLMVSDSISYPVHVNSVDDSGKIELRSPEEARSFVSHGLMAIRHYVDSGTVLKDKVRQAKAIEDVASVLDDRDFLVEDKLADLVLSDRAGGVSEDTGNILVRWWKRIWS